MSLAPSLGHARRVQAEPRPRHSGWGATLEYVCLAVLSLAVLATLGTYAYRGWFARYTADDYCTTGLEQTLGFVGAQVWWYEFWSGRMTYYFVVGLVEYAGPRVVQVLPAVALALWVGVGAWALLPLARHDRWPAPRIMVVLGSAAVIFVSLTGAPQLDQALYWMTGMLTYLLPLVLLTAYAGWLARRLGSGQGGRLTWRDVAFSGIYLLAVGGLSETSLSIQLAGLGLGVCLSAVLLRSRRYRALPVLLAVGFIATVISGVIVVAAPGNYVHEASLTGGVHGLSQLPGAIQSSVDFAGLFARAVEFRARSAVLLLLALSVGLGIHTRWVFPRRLGWSWYAASIPGVLVVGWLMLLAATAPGYYAQEWDPPERAQFVAVWVVALTFGCVGYPAGHVVGEAGLRLGLATHPWIARLASCAVVLLCALTPLPAVRATLALVPGDAGYAAAWDSLDATLRSDAAAGQPIVLSSTLPTHYGFDFLGGDPAAYPNPCVARFYGVPSIAVSQAN